ncbi:MAG: zinc ribbon domain-containing protein [Candidatus Paceibacterota bacterium]
MFCSKCGAKNSEDVKFCGGCGFDISKDGVAESNVQKFKYYGKNWKGARLLPLGLWSGSTYYDVAVDNDYVYFIKLPPYSSAFWFGLLGLIVLNLIGLLIGVAVGRNIDSNKRESTRKTWINDEKIVSRLYEGRVSQKIKISNLRDNAKFKKNSLVFAINDKNHIFKTSSKQFTEFTNSLS